MTKEPKDREPIDDLPEVNKEDYKYIADDDSEEILKQERALQPLLLVLQNGTPELKVMTIEAIGAIPTAAAIKVLEEALSDPDEAIRAAAKTALARYNT